MNPKTGTFYTISNVAYSQGPFYEGLYGDIIITMANKITHYERKVYSILDVISDVGGFNQIVIMLFGFLFKMYSNKLYEFESVSEFYKMKPNSTHNPDSISNADNS